MTPDHSAVRASVVIATKNRRQHLAQVLRALAEQTMEPDRFEVIVVDDGSTDGTSDLLDHLARQSKGLVVRWLRQASRGPGEARNRGIELAVGPITLFTDDDCLPEKGWIAAMVAALAAHPEAVGAEGCTYTVLTAPTPFQHFAANSGGFYPTCNVAYRTALLRRVGGFDVAAFPGANKEDVDLAYRVMRFGPIVYVDQARIFHPARPASVWWQIRRMRRLLPDELCMLLRWPRGRRRYAQHTFANVAGREIEAGGRLVSAPIPMRGPALLARLDWLRDQPGLYARVVAMLTVRSAYGLSLLPGALWHAWRHRHTTTLPPLASRSEGGTW